MSARVARKIEVRREWETVLAPHKNSVLYLRSVLTWERPIDYVGLVILLALGSWLTYHFEITLLTLFSSLTVAWVLGSYLLDRFNVAIPWGTILPAHYNDPNTDYYTNTVVLLVDVRCNFSEAWDDLIRFRAVNETRFVIQVTLLGSLLAYVGAYLSGDTLFFVTLAYALVIPGIFANSVPQRAYVVIEPHVRVYAEKSVELKNLVLAWVNERIASLTAKKSGASSSSSTSSSSTATESSSSEPASSSSEPAPAAPVTEEEHPKAD